MNAETQRTRRNAEKPHCFLLCVLCASARALGPASKERKRVARRAAEGAEENAREPRMVAVCKPAGASFQVAPWIGVFRGHVLKRQLQEALPVPISMASSLRPLRLCASFGPASKARNGLRAEPQRAQRETPGNHGWLPSENQPV